MGQLSRNELKIASSRSVVGADGVGDVVRMIVRESDIGTDLDSDLAGDCWVMIGRRLLGERRIPASRHARLFRCVSTFLEQFQVNSIWLWALLLIDAAVRFTRSALEKHCPEPNGRLIFDLSDNKMKVKLAFSSVRRPARFEVLSYMRGSHLEAGRFDDVVRRVRAALVIRCPRFRHPAYKLATIRLEKERPEMPDHLTATKLPRGERGISSVVVTTMQALGSSTVHL